MLNYPVHTSWNRHRWDEWVQPTRLLKFNETNIALQKALLAQANAASGSSSASSAKGINKSTSAKDAGRFGRKDGGTRGTKRGREEVCGRPVAIWFAAYAASAG